MCRNNLYLFGNFDKYIIPVSNDSIWNTVIVSILISIFTSILKITKINIPLSF